MTGLKQGQSTALKTYQRIDFNITRMFSLYIDPLEQFSVEILISYCYFDINFWLPTTSVGRMITFNFICVLLLIYSLFWSSFVVSKLQKMVFFTFIFVSNILMNTIKIKKYSFILLLYTTFLFILLSNFLGMVPYTMTITSHIIITLYFSLAIFIGSNLIGVCYLKQKFFLLFLPDGVPLVIGPYIIIIEYISYISRVFSLAIRLFANMLSGHILLKILISFVWVTILSNPVHWLWNIFPGFLVVSVIGLEFSIALLQSYVFIVLISIYFNDLISPH